MSLVVTMADRGYLARAEVLMDSIVETNPKQEIGFLGLGDVQHSDVAYRVSGANFMKFEDLLEKSPPLAKACQTRNKAERYFTSLPSFLRELMAKVPQGEWLVYLDADIYVYQPLADLLPEAQDKSAVIVPHRHYRWNRRRLAKFGAYNVGLVAFRNDSEGRKLLDYWADSCIQWCSDKPVAGLYADQKYLEHFEEISDAVVVDRRIGANLAPWNSSLLSISSSGSTLFADDQLVLYFHMQGLRRTSKHWYLGHIPYFSLAGRALRELVYRPYLSRLEKKSWENGTLSGSARESLAAGTKLLSRLTLGLAALLRQRISIRSLEGGVGLDSD